MRQSTRLIPHDFRLQRQIRSVIDKINAIRFSKQIQCRTRLHFLCKYPNQLQIELLNAFHTIPSIICNAVRSIANDQINAFLLNPVQQVEGIALVNLIRFQFLLYDHYFVFIASVKRLRASTSSMGNMTTVFDCPAPSPSVLPKLR